MAREDLRRRQAATAHVREKVLAMLLQFTPAHELTVGDVRWIADMAANAAFDAFDPDNLTITTPLTNAHADGE